MLTRFLRTTSCSPAHANTALSHWMVTAWRVSIGAGAFHFSNISCETPKWTHGEDRSSGNKIRGNRIATHGSECVDVKEGSYGNTIEENTCSDQLEEKSGCFSVRGDSNTVR